ncbi:MAG TPA: ferredoxin [Chitinophagales bacterium]|nr:ferredoxin [Chitinophagales bacterium]MCB9074758.1 ferredoxin [Chitinophagales bacterium]HMU98444.1 ferredoxin [Chitinophagales bacterium]HMV03008.1 ferredoxin [Chitinophagales bacterium]HMW95013.1 ferredoxin [Chitinophagales bacterium]
MITIIQQRAKCIGCNYCVELAPQRWRMSKKDGKSVLLGAIDKKGFWSVKVREDELDSNIAAAKACPVNIIQVIE